MVVEVERSCLMVAGNFVDGSLLLPLLLVRPSPDIQTGWVQKYPSQPPDRNSALPSQLSHLSPHLASDAYAPHASCIFSRQQGWLAVDQWANFGARCRCFGTVVHRTFEWSGDPLGKARKLYHVCGGERHQLGSVFCSLVGAAHA